jgi:rhodanese-related sulfurtransferase
MREMSVRELKLRLSGAQPPLLLDVRRHDERSIARIEPSLFIPLHQLAQRAEELEAHRGRLFVVYCHHGVRSLHASQYLQSLGFDSTSLHGGIEAWSIEIDPDVTRY